MGFSSTNRERVFVKCISLLLIVIDKAREWMDRVNHSPCGYVQQKPGPSKPLRHRTHHSVTPVHAGGYRFLVSLEHEERTRENEYRSTPPCSGVVVVVHVRGLMEAPRRPGRSCTMPRRPACTPPASSARRPGARRCVPGRRLEAPEGLQCRP